MNTNSESYGCVTGTFELFLEEKICLRGWTHREREREIRERWKWLQAGVEYYASQREKGRLSLWVLYCANLVMLMRSMILVCIKTSCPLSTWDAYAFGPLLPSISRYFVEFTDTRSSPTFMWLIIVTFLKDSGPIQI